MQGKKRKITSLTVAALLIAVLLSLLAPFAVALHDCHGEDCFVCAAFPALRQQLDSLSLAVAIGLWLFALVFIFKCSIQSCYHIKRPTLISNKVKLSN